MKRPRGRPRVLDHAVLAERAVRLYKQGLGHRKIARKLGVAPATVRRILLTTGVPMRRPGRPPRKAVDPVWGKLAFIMYRPRTPDELEDFALPPGHVPVDLGGKRILSTTPENDS